MNLNDPTPKSEIKQRQGPKAHPGDCDKPRCHQSHVMLDYIDARFVMDRLDAAVGAAHWQDRYEDRADGSVRCGIGIYFQVEGWVWKWDVGDPSDIEPTKGVHADAFKRAGVKWGIGRDLYGDHVPPKPVQQPTKPVEPPGPSFAPGDRPWPAEDVVPLVQKIFPDAVPLDDEDTCPVHGYTWKRNSKGFYCSGKTEGKWCTRKPSIAWAARQIAHTTA